MINDVFTDLEPVGSFSKHLKERYKYRRFISDYEEWPPDQPKHFTTLAMIHHKSGRTEKEVIEITKATQSGKIDCVMSPFSQENDLSEESQEFLRQTKASKDLTDLFLPSDDNQGTCSILIEGAPGIGKTVLSKEISVRWANGLLLLGKILVFLIFFRNPVVQKRRSLADLVKYFYQFDNSSDKIADGCAKYLLQSGGKHVAFIFDGYDEYPEALREGEGFIPDLLQRKILPACVLVVTSRHYASARLHKNVDRRVEILGFTKDDRLHFIQSSLKGKQDDVCRVVKYLDGNPIIDRLCFIPFNMTVLLWLYKLSIKLPKNLSELYNYFVCHTIRRNLAKQVKFDENISNLQSLPQPYKTILQQLSALSYEALKDYKLTFTLEEIKSACPQINSVDGAINCFGLLQAVKFFGASGTAVSLNFLHLSIQEYLAAYHVSCRPHDEELQILKKDFRSGFYLNTFTIYVGITRGQRPAFLEYLTGCANVNAIKNIKILPELTSKMFAFLHFLRCFYEADNEELCAAVAKSEYIAKGVIDLRGFQINFPSEIECLGSAFCSRREWLQLNFSYCFSISIQDRGIEILHKVLSSNVTIIQEIVLSYCDLTSSVSPLIADIVKGCKTNSLQVHGNFLENMLPLLKETHLQSLCIDITNNESVVTNAFEFLQRNKCLKILCLHSPRYRREILSNESAVEIALALKHNDILQSLRFPGGYYPLTKDEDLWKRLTTSFPNFKVGIGGRYFQHS